MTRPAAAATATASASAGGIGLSGLFFLVLFVLKILGYLTWPWWVITAPLWGPLAAMGIALVVLMFLYGVVSFFEDQDKKKAAAKRAGVRR